MQTNFHPDEPEIHGNGKRKRKKTYAIEWRWKAFEPFKDWTVLKKYETVADRDKAFEALRKEPYSAEYRIKE